jgi:hypothetical protein
MAKHCPYGDNFMNASLLPSLRNLRVSLITGAIIVASLYTLFLFRFEQSLTISQPAKNILGISPYMPQVLLAMLCLLVGSLYMTALEGLVDLIHRRLVSHSNLYSVEGIKGVVIRSLAPLSISAQNRISVEAGRFFDEHAPSVIDAVQNNQNKNDFVSAVIREILWLDGKLAGTPLENPYDQFRAEGELRLGTAILLPLAAAATCHSIGFSLFQIGLITLLITIASLKLADYGLYYFRRAHSFMAHHISDGKVLAPAMEALIRANPKPKQPRVIRVQMIK